MRILNTLLLAGILGTGLAVADTPTPDQAVIKKVVHEIRMYPYYSIWDNINVHVDNGNVEISGAVSQPYKKSDIQRLVAHVPGVTTVTNDLKVLPLNSMDNRLRAQVARAIYRDPMFTGYAMEAVPPIHIIVENGHVTLEGVVNTEAQKEVAGIRANGAGLSFGMVVNNLRVETPAPKHVS
jgi:hyperosmotically inducible protein